MLGAGLLISTVSATQQQAMVTAFFLIMPGITFSGFGSWLTIQPRASGVGNGFVSFSATSDTTDSGRDAAIIIGDQVFHVLQTAGANTIVVGPGSGHAPVASGS